MFWLFSLLFSLFFITSCASPEQKPPEKSQAEIRHMQTKMFDRANSKLVLKSVLSALQDGNFIVKHQALDLGFVTATKEIDIERSDASFWGKFQKSENISWPKCEIIEATISVCDIDNKTRLRANFQSKTMDNKGAIKNVHQITDDAYYQEFFKKVEQEI